MGRKSDRFGAVLGPVGLVVLAALIIRGAGGLGLRAFVNLEALLFVVFGTLLLLWAAYPVRRWREVDVLAYASQCATVAGVIGTLLGVIILLSSGDLSAAPRRVALSLNALFFGLLLSKAFLLPMARRHTRGRRAFA